MTAIARASTLRPPAGGGPPARTTAHRARPATCFGLPRAFFRARCGLRILCYHGVCDDALVGEAWIPAYYVGASQFAAQLRLLRRFARPAFLPEVSKQWHSGRRLVEEPAFAVTFDDVAACTFVHAREALREAGVRATFFLATGHTTTGRLFNADLLRLLRVRPDLGGAASAEDRAAFDLVSWLVQRPGEHKCWPLEHLREPLERAANAVRKSLDPELYEVLRPMNWDEARSLADDGHEIAAHTVDHANLAWQDGPTRRAQIVQSTRDIHARLGSEVVGFAYPNGGPDDFDESDVAVLREVGVRYAVTTRPGFARRGGPADVYRWPRVGIGRDHTLAKFAWEISGLRDAQRRRQYRWP